MGQDIFHVNQFIEVFRVNEVFRVIQASFQRDV